MGILRTAIVLAGIAVLVPADEKERQILFASVETKVRWAATFCDREPASCVKAAELVKTFGAKALEGATVVGGLILDKGSDTSERRAGVDGRGSIDELAAGY